MTADRSDGLEAKVRDASCHLLHKPVRNARLRSLLAHLLGGRAGAAAPDALSTR